MQLKGRQMISQGPNTGIGLSAHIYSSKKRTQLWQLAWVIKLPFSFLGRLENCETLWQSLQGGANLVLPSGVLQGPRYITTFDNKVSFKHATHHNHQKGLSLAYQDMQISRFTYELCYKIICFFFWSNAEPTERTHKTWRSPRQTRTKVWRRPGNAKKNNWLQTSCWRGGLNVGQSNVDFGCTPKWDLLIQQHLSLHPLIH